MPKGKLTSEQKAEKQKKFQATLEKNRLQKLSEMEAKESSGTETTQVTEQINTVKMDKSEDKEKQQLLSIIEEQNRKFEELNKKIEELANKPATTQQVFTQNPVDKQKQKFGGNLRSEIPPEDRIKGGKQYTAIGGTWIMNCYMKDGTMVYAPYEKNVIFTPYCSDIKLNKHGEKVQCNYTAFLTYSKKVCDYIEQSPYFGNLIYANQKEALAVDYEALEKIKIAGESVNKLNQMQLMNMAESYGVSRTLTDDAIKKELINIKIAELMQGEKRATVERLANINNPTPVEATER